MKRVAAPTQPLIALYCALVLVVALTFAGCSANAISGPDLAPSQEVTQAEKTSTDGPSAPHNEGESADKKGVSTTQHADRN